MASDHDVIAKFAGNFVSNEGAINPDKTKNAYYPKAGVKLQLKMIKLHDKPGGAYAKIKIDPSGEGFDAALALEHAVFRVENDRLVAKDIEVAPGLLLKETLSMIPDSRKMQHDLEFSDGASGSWICNG